MSTYGSFKRCSICSQYDFENTHRCPPAWEVQLENEKDEWRIVYAGYSDDAAKKFAERYDSDGDYSIVNGDELTVQVRKAYDEDAEVEWFCVRGETVPAYYADKVDAPEHPPHVCEGEAG